MSRRFAVVSVLLLLWLLLGATACGPTLVRKGARPTARPEATVSVGKGLTTAVPSIPPAVTTGALAIRVTDQNGRHPAGIPIEIEGPVDASAVTDPTGTLKIVGKAGRYTARVVPGCSKQVHVFGAGFVTIGLNAGETKTRDLTVKWRHRISPAPPIFANPPSAWPIGQKIDVRYDVVDRCQKGRVPNAGFSTFAFETSRNLKLIGAPVFRSDADGHAHVVVSCVSDGDDLALLLRDRANRSDAVDFLREVFSYGPEPHCVRS